MDRSICIYITPKGIFFLSTLYVSPELAWWAESPAFSAWSLWVPMLWANLDSVLLWTGLPLTPLTPR